MLISVNFVLCLAPMNPYVAAHYQRTKLAFFTDNRVSDNYEEAVTKDIVFPNLDRSMVKRATIVRGNGQQLLDSTPWYNLLGLACCHRHRLKNTTREVDWVVMKFFAHY